MINIVNLGYDHAALLHDAQQLALRLNLHLNKTAEECLFLSDSGLSIKLPGFNLLAADFSLKTWMHRRSEGRKQGLVKACKPVSKLKIIDTTAGWGRDAAVLASLGAEVVLIERNKVMAALLEDALQRQSQSDQKNLTLSLHYGDASDYLSALKVQDYPDVIYIDPMHPQRTKSALVKKDLQILQEMIGPDNDALDLLHLAVSKAKQRVVVKWPQKNPPLMPTSTSIPGKTVRFDIYSTYQPPQSLR